jgi:hypothetical protein
VATPPPAQALFDPFLPPPAAATCRFCGGYPAADVTVRAHRGMVVLMQFRSVDGPFCRTCGTAAVRDLSAQTLVEGWWGLFSVFITPLTLFGNLLEYRTVRALPEPVRSESATPVPAGKPLLLRPQALGFLVPVLALVLFFGALVSSSSAGTRTGAATATAFPPAAGNAAAVGTCVVNAGTTDTPYLVPIHCFSGTLQVVGRLPGTDQTNCPSDTTEAYTVSDAGQDVVICLKDYAG